MNKKKNNYIPPSVENAINTIMEYCSKQTCIDCPLMDSNRCCKLDDIPEYWRI